MSQPSEINYSFEIYPPKQGGKGVPADRLIPELIDLKPTFISVTYGALQSGNQSRTFDLAEEIQNQGTSAVAHFTSVGATKDAIDASLDEMERRGIHRILAVRGDRPADLDPETAPEGDLKHGNDLIRHIESRGNFEILAPAYPEKHPEAETLDSDIHYLKDKVVHGSTRLLTQFFFDNAHFYQFVDRCGGEGIHALIEPGIMPAVNLAQITRLANNCGAVLPDGLLETLKAAGDDKKAVRAAGIQYAIDQIIDLVQHGFTDIHLYTMNKPKVTKEIVEGGKKALNDLERPSKVS